MSDQISKNITAAFKTSDDEYHDSEKAARHHQAHIDIQNLLEGHLVTRIYDSENLDTEKLVNLFMRKTHQDEELMGQIEYLCEVIKETAD